MVYNVLLLNARCGRSSIMKAIVLLVASLFFSLPAITEEDYEPVGVAGNHHLVRFENEDVRILEVVIAPGDTVPFHQHTMDSVFVTLQPAALVFRDLEGNIIKEVDRSDFTDLPDYDARTAAPAPRSVENIDSITMKAIRIELK
jgi:predicted metal-dependent enzyme (double-stranded beta helix superfamily)